MVCNANTSVETFRSGWGCPSYEWLRSAGELVIESGRIANRDLKALDCRELALHAGGREF